jgi:hypothetical protein
VLVWTGPAVFFVWGAVIAGLASLAVSEDTTARNRLLSDPRFAAPLAGGVAFIVFVAVWSVQALPPNGDEPHYLVVAQSLLLDGDLRVANNYDRADYAAYYSGFLRPHFSRPGIGGTQYSVHAPGLPAFVAPAFALGGYRGVVLWIAACAAFGTFLVWRAGYLLTGEAGSAWFGWAAVALTAPVVLHGTLVYPDPLAGVVLAAGTLALVAANGRRVDGQMFGDAGRAPWTPSYSMILGLAIGSLPWLHSRLAVPAAVLGALLGLHVSFGERWSRSRGRHILALCSPLLLLAGAWLVFFRLTYGTFNPAAPYGDQSPLELRSIVNGALGLLADQEFGLLANAPVHLLALVGLGVLAWRSRRLGFELLAVVAPYAIVSSAFPLWWAGSSAPARFLVPIVFPLGVAAAVLWSRQSSRARAMSTTWLGASVLIAMALSFGGDGRLAYNAASGRARWLDWIEPLVDLAGGFPSFFRGRTAPGLNGIPIELLRPALRWAAALAGGWLSFVALDKGMRGSRPGRVLTAPICLLLSCAGAVVVSWRSIDDHVTATRAQLELLRRRDRVQRPVGVQLTPSRLLSARDVLNRLSLTTSLIDPHPRAALLYLEEVPPGSYRLRIAGRASAHGTLALGIGRASMPAANWPLEASAHASLMLPVQAALITVTGDAEALQAVDRVALIPDESPGARAPDFEPAPVPWLAGVVRARDAARYGGAVVYALDDRVWLEAAGFWVMGARSPTIAMASDQPVESFTVHLRNGPGSNRIKISSASWSSERALAAAEQWSVRVPLSQPSRSALIRFEVERSFVPSDLDPSSGDRRALGCWVEVR